MNSKFITSLTAVAAAATTVFSATSPASAFSWGGWTNPTPTVQSKTTAPQDFRNLFSTFDAAVQQERLAVANPLVRALDISNLRLKSDHDVKVYFINEGAGYKNQLAYESTNGSSYQKGMVFANASGYDTILPDGDGPLYKGDFVSLGNISAGSQLNFWLKANGYYGGQHIYGADQAANPDGLQHVVSYLYNNRYLLIGFEDLYGDLWATGGLNERSDRDFNDTVFVVDVGVGNVVGVPEPSLMVGMLGMGTASLLSRRRRQSEKA